MAAGPAPLPQTDHPAWSQEPLSRFSPALRATVKAQALRAGQVVFNAGQRPAWMHFVAAGEVTMSRCDRDGRCLILQRASDSFLAEASLHSARYHCDAQAVGRALLWSFPLRALRQAIDDDPATRWAWIAMLGAEIRRQRAQGERLALKTVRARLLHLLVTQGDDGRVRVPGSRKNLAAQLGVSHEALYRTIAALQRERVIDARGEVLALR